MVKANGKAKVTQGPMKKAGTALTKWEAALAARTKIATKAASNLGTGGNFVSFRGGVMQYKGNPVDGNSMDIVIPSFLLENQFYIGPFDPDNPSSPVCYAFGTEPKDMRPHENSPQPQAEQCKGCPNNEWGTADKGRGKACKNVVRLGLLPVDCLEGGAEGVRDAEEAIAKLPVTSGKAWGGYVSQLAAVEASPLQFVTEMAELPDPKTQFKITFKAKEQIEDGATIEALLARADAMDKTLAAPYPDFDEAPSKTAKTAKAPKAPVKATKAPAPKAITPAARRAMAQASAARAEAQVPKAPALGRTRKF